MDDMPESQNHPRAERLSRLSRQAGETRQQNTGHTKFIRSMRIILPLIALSIVAVMFTWNTLQENDIAPPPPADGQPTPRIGKNELISPRFESLDEKNQPYTITATRAVQDTDDELLLLDEPMADITLKSGTWLAINARQGAYRQQSQRLLLKDNVTMYHDAGYSVKTQELDVDLKDGTAQTDVTVQGYGPGGTLDAAGLRADQKAGTLILTGPAKVVIYDTGKNILNP